MLSRLYDALRAGGVPEHQARAAAEEVATYRVLKNGTCLPKWMVGILTALVLGIFWMQRQALAALADIDARLGAVETRLTNVEQRLGALERGFRDFSERMSNVERRLGDVEQRLPPP